MNVGILELLQQDIKDLKSIINYKNYGLNYIDMKKQARGIILNLEDHLETFIKTKG